MILVVENDQAVQGIAEDALSEGGFEVAIAGSGEEALTLLTGNSGGYRALVIDINLLGRLGAPERSPRNFQLSTSREQMQISGRRKAFRIASL